MKSIINLLGILFLTLAISCGDDPIVPTCEENLEELQINEYQTIGSHNSYRKSTTPEIFTFLHEASDILPPGFDPATFDYTQESIEDQLNIYGMRSFELDIYRDPEGGLFYNRIGNAFVGLDIASNEPKLLEPGLKVLHFPDVDYNSEFLTFIDAIEYIRDWSIANPRHLPITILVQAKEDSPDALLPDMGLTASLPFEDNSVEEIEIEINAVFASDPGHILTPDDVRNGNTSLRKQITTDGWPTVEETRGKIAFVLMARGGIIESYVDGHSSLSERKMFVFTDAHMDEAAFLKIDDPTSRFQVIKNYVDQGFIVRTRADADTDEARTGDYSRMNDAFASGAQIISTDYYRADPRSISDIEWTDYEVMFEGGKLAMIRESIVIDENIDCELDE